MWLYFVFIGLIAIAILALLAGCYYLIRGTRDKKPLLVSFILQRDDCSRLLGEFADKHLPKCSKLVIIWKNGSEDIQVISSESTEEKEATMMLIASANEIGERHGIKAGIILS